LRIKCRHDTTCNIFRCPFHEIVLSDCEFKIGRRCKLKILHKQVIKELNRMHERYLRKLGLVYDP